MKDLNEIDAQGDRTIGLIVSNPPTQLMRRRRALTLGIWARYILNFRRFFGKTDPMDGLSPEQRATKLPASVYAAPLPLDENGETDSSLNHPVSLN